MADPLYSVAADLELCSWCGGFAKPGTTCPQSVGCPECKAEPGQRCRRPSGHGADVLHRIRISTAEKLDEEGA